MSEAFNLMMYQNHVHALTMEYMRLLERSLNALRLEYEKRGILPVIETPEVELDDADKAIRGER